MLEIQKGFLTSEVYPKCEQCCIRKLCPGIPADPVCCSGAGLGSAEAATPVDYSAGAACYDWQAADYQEYKV